MYFKNKSKNCQTDICFETIAGAGGGSVFEKQISDGV